MRFYSPRYFDIIARTIHPILEAMNIKEEHEGLENVVEEVKKYDINKGLFFFSNHLSWADHFLIMKVIYDNIREDRVSPKQIKGQVMSALAKESYFKYPIAGTIIKHGNQIPITNTKIEFKKWYNSLSKKEKLKFQERYLLNEEKQSLNGQIDNLFYLTYMRAIHQDPNHPVNENTRKSLQETADNVKTSIYQGKLILAYPEGTRSKTRKMQQLKTGAIQLPLQLRSKIIPVAIIGTDGLFPRDKNWKYLFTFINEYIIKKTSSATVKVKFGKSIGYEEILQECRKEYQEKEKISLVNSLHDLETKIDKNEFKAFSKESEAYSPIFSSSTVYVMSHINNMLPEEYQAKIVQAKY